MLLIGEDRVCERSVHGRGFNAVTAGPVRSRRLGIEFRILGPLEVVDGDRVVTVGGARQRALLAVLLLHAGETLSGDRLVDELWGDRPPPTAAKTVQVYISRLRRALGDGGMIATREHGYELAARARAPRRPAVRAPGRAKAAASWPRAARRGRRRRSRRRWRCGAGGRWRIWPSRRSPRREIARLDDLRVAALELLTEAELALGRHADLLGRLERLVAEHPYRERLRAQLMLALYRSDRRPTRWRPTATPAARWPTSSGSSRASGCASSSARS